jgi:hypothetical protein
VTLATRAGRDGGVRIVVRDRGVGIAADDLAHVFDPYFTTRRTGTGLGLPIAKNIVEGLGGSIGVAERPRRGHGDRRRAAGRAARAGMNAARVDPDGRRRGEDPAAARSRAARRGARDAEAASMAHDAQRLSSRAAP